MFSQKREIEFRIWDKQNKEFSEYTNRDPFFSTSNGKIFFWERTKDGDQYTGDIVMSDTGDRFVLQQFTGMKDRNGKKVYEGDIVAENFTPEMAANGDTATVGHIFFAAGTFMINGDGPLCDHVYGISPDILEDFLVVGHIFENPEKS